MSTESNTFWACGLPRKKARPFGRRYAPTCPTVGSKTSSLSAVTSFKGLPEAGEVTWPGSMVQTCVVYLIRAANRWVVCGDRKGVSAALEKVYTAFDEAGAAAARSEFVDSELGEKHPRFVKVWCDAWERFVPFCSFRRQPAMLSTSRIRLSCLTMSCVNLPATASNFTNDESALKTLWLMICNIEDKRLAKRAKEGWRVARFSRPPCRRRESLRMETSHQPNGRRLTGSLRPIPLRNHLHTQTT